MLGFGTFADLTFAQTPADVETPPPAPAPERVPIANVINVNRLLNR